MRLAARTLEQCLTRDLTLTVGYAELIAEDPELPERLREMANLVVENAEVAMGCVRRMRQIEALSVVDSGVPGGPLLDEGAGA